MSMLLRDVTPCSSEETWGLRGGGGCITSTSRVSKIACFMLSSYFAYSSALRMEAICSSEATGYFFTTLWYIPEDRDVWCIYFFERVLLFKKIWLLCQWIYEYGNAYVLKHHTLKEQRYWQERGTNDQLISTG
jgi:hypothetical protein